MDRTSLAIEREAVGSARVGRQEEDYMLLRRRRHPGWLTRAAHRRTAPFATAVASGELAADPDVMALLFGPGRSFAPCTPRPGVRASAAADPVVGEFIMPGVQCPSIGIRRQ